MEILKLQQKLADAIEAADTEYGLSQLGSPFVAKAILSEGPEAFEATALMQPDTAFFDALYDRAVILHRLFGIPVRPGMREAVKGRSWPILRAGGLAVITGASTGWDARNTGQLRLLQPGDPEFEATKAYLHTEEGFANATKVVDITRNILTDSRTIPLRNDYRLATAHGITSPNFPELGRDTLRNDMIDHVQEMLVKGYNEANIMAPGVIGTLSLRGLAPGLVTM